MSSGLSRIIKFRAVAVVAIALLLAVALPLSLNPQPRPTAPVVLSGQSATILSDGRWLLVGGEGTSAPLSTIAIWDPNTTATTTLPVQLQQTRAWHTATVLPDGKLLILGGLGSGGRVVQQAEVLDLNAQTSSVISYRGQSTRSRHTATLLTDGSVLIAGGIGNNNQAMDSAELWDPADGSVTQVPDLASARGSHSATLTDDGKVLLRGGTNRSGVLITGEVFDPATDTFATLNSGELNKFTLPSTPYLSASLPSNNAVDVPVDSVFSLRFSKPLLSHSVNSTSISLNGPKGIENIKVVVAEAGMLAFVTPQAALLPGATYSVTVNGAVDRDGLLLPISGFSFSTRPVAGVTSSAGAAAASGATGAKITPATPTPVEQQQDLSDDDDDTEWRGVKKDGKPHSDWQDLPPLKAPDGETALAGQVLDLRGRPLANVVMTVESSGYGGYEWKATTDETGRFLVRRVMAGRSELIIDGQQARLRDQGRRRNYGLFEYGLKIKNGQTNVLDFTIWLPRIDVRHAVRIPSPTTSEVVVTTPKIPGMELRIPPGTTITDHEGKTVREVSLTPIPVDRPPFPLPRQFQVPIYFTAQPGGAYLYGSQGARLTYPNHMKEAPGGRGHFWHYDTGPRGWYVYGMGTVTADGKQVVPDPGVGIYEFTGAMMQFGGAAEKGGCVGTNCAKGGDPVDLASGLFIMEKTDLYLPDVIPIALTRSYHQLDTSSRSFGVGMSHLYSMFLSRPVGDNLYVEANLILPDQGRVRYSRTSGGESDSFTDAVYEHRGPTGCPNHPEAPECVGSPSMFYGSRIVWNGTGWDLTLKDGTVYVFGDNLPIQAIRDRHGNQVTIVRNLTTPEMVERVISPNGRWIEFTYDSTFSGPKRIVQAKDSFGRTVQYEYHPTLYNRLHKVTDPNSGITEYGYGTNDRMTTIKDARGITYLTNVYDATTGRITKQTQIDTGEYNFAYTTDSQGKITRTEVTDPRNKVRRIDFNSAGYIATETLALGLAEEQVISSTIQAGSNLVQSHTDGLGRKTSYTYDTKGNVLTVTRMADTAGAATTTYTYDPVYNQLATVTDPLNHTTTFGRDSKGNLTSITNPAPHTNEVTTLTYHPDGQLASISDPLQNKTQFGYTFGDLTSAADPLGNVSLKSVDAAGRVLSTVNPLGHQSGYEYDVLNRLKKVTDPLNGLTQFDYDPNGNLTKVTDARGGQTQYDYDNMDRLQARKDPLYPSDATHIEQYHYDLAGNMDQFTDRKNQQSTYTYDGLNRRTGVTYSGGSTTSYSYDKANRLTQVNDSIAGIITRTYNDVNRTYSEQTPQGTVSYTFDAAGRRSTMTVPGQSQVVYSYDNANRLTQITQGSATVIYGYDLAGRRQSMTLPNGVLVQYGYDAASRLTSITYKQNGTTLLGDLTYEYDKAGQRTKVGGSFARTGVPQTISTTSYDAANRQTVFGDKFMTFDNNGNLQTISDNAGTTTYTWNTRNQLTGVSGPVNASFFYDGLGRREKKIVNGTTTEFLYDGLNPVQETDGTPVTANILTGLGIDEFLTRHDVSTGVTSSVLTDALGSALALTNSSGTVQTQYTYEPFGLASTTGAVNSGSYQYTGRENDGTGLYYYRARYYHSTLQRFLAEDPIGFGGGDSNYYSYVGNQPLNATDPSGLFMFWVHGIASFMSGVLEGMSLEEAAFFAGTNMGADFSFGSQDVARANEHSMRTPQQSVLEGVIGTEGFIDRMLEPTGSRLFDIVNLGRAVHARDDGFSPVHAGHQEYRGFPSLGEWWNHARQELWTNDWSALISAQRKIIRDYKRLRSVGRRK